MLTITSQSMLFIVLFCVPVFMSLTAALPHIVAFSHEYLHIFLCIFFLSKHCNAFLSYSHIPTAQNLDNIEVIFSATNEQINCFKRNIGIYIKIAPTCFDAVSHTIFREFKIRA
jgi:hypothetical protein